MPLLPLTGNMTFMGSELVSVRFVCPVVSIVELRREFEAAFVVISDIGDINADLKREKSCRKFLGSLTIQLPHTEKIIGRAN